MRTTWILASIAALTVSLPVACGGSGSTSSGTGGTTGTGGRDTTASTTSSTGGGGVVSSGGTGGTLDCGGVLMAGACDTCAKDGCCKELAACKATSGCVACYGDDKLCTVDSQPPAAALLVCLQSSCAKECMLAPPVGDATCAVAPSPTGACVTLDAKVTCNPVTSAPCNTGAGEACDLADGGGFKCYPPFNDRALCETCGAEGAYCQGGLTCIGVCARYCCDDADCGAGKCDKTTYTLGDTVGVCLGGNG